MRLFCLTLLLAACNADVKLNDTAGSSNTTENPGEDSSIDDPGSTDSDGDGYTADEDCDDGDGSVNPLATELCDGRDNDCDGQTDEDVTTTWFLDADQDSYGDTATATSACAPPDGYTGQSGDCDDADPLISPAAPESCDGVDNDCDGDTDEDVTTTYYADADADGFGDDTTATAACAAPDGYTSAGGDCDDDNPAYHPSAAEDDCTDPNDYNCDGVVSYADADADGWAACAECDDANAAIFPGAPEVCNDLDDDCDGAIDDDATDALIWYADADADGFGDDASTIAACTLPDGYTTDAADCDDSNAAIFPGAPEVCNDLDDDCDGSVDSGAIDATLWYADSDGDGYGDPGTTDTACNQPTNYITDATDCDDANAAIFPGAPEICNDLDDDCDGVIDDDATDATIWYADSDGDGYGDAGATLTQCGAPSGYLGVAEDCDDTNAAISPDAPEVCNDLDDDCDGSVDSGAADAPTWYADSDGDGYSDAASSLVACDQPDAHLAASTGPFDCDDATATTFPGAEEVCNGVDDDCDGVVDGPELEGTTTWYADVDGDGYGDPATTLAQCGAPSGYLSVAGDCDDTNAAISPDAEEICNDVDDDCDGAADPPWVDSGLDSSTTEFALVGDARQVWDGSDGYFELADNDFYEAGAAWYMAEIPTDRLYVAFSFEMTNGTGGDGLTVSFLDTYDPSHLGDSGNNLGANGAPGYAVEFDSYFNFGDPNSNHVGLTATEDWDTLSYATAVPTLDDGAHNAEVFFDRGAVDVYVDGGLVLSYTIDDYAQDTVMVGFTAATGVFYNEHRIDDLYIGCE